MKVELKRRAVLIRVLAILFSVFMIIGYSYTNYGSLSFVFSTFGHVLMCGLIGVIFYFIYRCIFKFLVNYLDNYSNNKDRFGIIVRHPFRVTFLVSLGVSLLYVVAFYPGVVTWDGFWQLDSAFGIRALTNHHPALLSLFMGLLMNIGRFIGNDNLGIFLYILIQILVSSLVYAYVVKVLNNIKTPRILLVITMLYFTMFPLISLNSVAYIKDSIYALLVLLYFVYSYNHLVVNKDYSNKMFLKLFLILALMYLFRNTGFYVGLVSLVVYGVNYHKNKKAGYKFGILLVLLIVLNGGYNMGLRIFHVNSSPVREMLSIPLQQTARYLKNYGNDLSKREKEALEDVFLIDIELIGDKYNPNKSDPIKWVFKSRPSAKEFRRYLGAWFTMFLKHPGVYVDATLNNTYGYFAPGVMNAIDEGLGFMEIEDNPRINTGYFKINFNDKTKFLRDFIYDLSYTWSNMPIIRLLYYPFVYVWVMIFMVGYSIYRRKRDMLVGMCPLYMTLFTCFISPLNAHMRYLLPLTIMILPAFAFMIRGGENEKIK